MSTSNRTGGSRVATVETVEATKAQVATALVTRSRELTSEEERVLRARRGIAAPKEQLLEKKASGDVLDELVLIELEIRRRYQAHLARLAAARPVPSPRKERIVRALRRKK